MRVWTVCPLALHCTSGSKIPGAPTAARGAGAPGPDPGRPPVLFEGPRSVEEYSGHLGFRSA